MSKSPKSEAASYNDSFLAVVCYAVWTSELALNEQTFFDYALPSDLNYDAYLAIEDLGSIHITDLDAFLAKAQPLYVSLTWNGENRLAGGCGCESGFTKKGISALKALAAQNIPLDLAHLSDTAALAALDSYGGKILTTHTAARSICPHPRCITDKMAKAIAARGGIIGVCAVPNFLDGSIRIGENCTFAAYIKHLCHLSSLVGTKHIAVGTDFYGAAYFPKGLSCYDDFAKLRPELERAGFSAAEVQDIFYNNASNFFQ